MTDEERRFEYIENFGCDEDDVLKALVREASLTQIHPRMMSGRFQGNLLAMLIGMSGAKKVLEIGTYVGYSAICMARALPNDGHLTTLEVNDEIEWLSAKYFKRSGLDAKITQIVGDALEIIPNLDDTFDMAFIDGDKREYIQYFDAVFPKISQGGLIVADNVIWYDKIFTKPASNDYMTQGIIAFNEYIRNRSDLQKIILPVRDGLMLIRKK